MKRILAALLILAPLGSAEAKSTTAKPKADQHGVLFEQLSPERWRIGYLGTGQFDASGVRNRILRKAAKLTLSRGFDWFEPIGEHPEPVESETATDPKRSTKSELGDPMRLKWGERCLAGWTFGPDPAALCQGPGEAAIRPFQATTQIMMGHGLTPKNGVALTARTIMKSAIS